MFYDAIANMSRNSMLKFVISEHPSIEYSYACIYMYMYMEYLNFAHFKLLEFSEESYPNPMNYEDFIRMK